MSQELKHLSPAQITGRVVFACGVTAIIAISVFYVILWLAGSR